MKWRIRESNPWRANYKAAALATELIPHFILPKWREWSRVIPFFSFIKIESTFLLSNPIYQHLSFLCIYDNKLLFYCILSKIKSQKEMKNLLTSQNKIRMIHDPKGWKRGPFAIQIQKIKLRRNPAWNEDTLFVFINKKLTRKLTKLKSDIWYQPGLHVTCVCLYIIDNKLFATYFDSHIDRQSSIAVNIYIYNPSTNICISKVESWTQKQLQCLFTGLSIIHYDVKRY